MVDKTIKEIKPQLESALAHFEEGLGALRTGRANPSLVEGVSVDCYGTKTPLKQIANVHAPDARSIVVQPWDKSNLKAIEKAISESELGLTCQNDGEAIRVNLPDLTEERRKELTKVLNQKIEEA
ncbi:ribosome recycling factor, partial [Patescibacteria group bacterium]